VFKIHAGADPRGWSNFVSDEVKEFIENAFCGTAVQKLKDDLEVAERKYRRLFEGSKDLIFITYKDGRFREVNQACVDLLRYRNKEELFSLGSVEKVYDKTTHWKVFKRQIDRDGFIKDFEALFRRKDGSRIHCRFEVSREKSSAIRALLKTSRPARMPLEIFISDIGSCGF
jgi:PAS domain S-box-containing protein